MIGYNCVLVSNKVFIDHYFFGLLVVRRSATKMAFYKVIFYRWKTVIHISRLPCIYFRH